MSEKKKDIRYATNPEYRAKAIERQKARYVRKTFTCPKCNIRVKIGTSCSGCQAHPANTSQKDSEVSGVTSHNRDLNKQSSK